MTENEFRIFLDLSIPEYAREKVKAGNWNASESMEKSRNAFDKLLPKGLESIRPPPVYDNVPFRAGGPTLVGI